ncbi:hypothetical protein GCM10022270_31680 [Terriglobus aquaticus]
MVIALLLLGFGLLWHAHQRAKFHQLTTPEIPQTTSAPMPGGQEAILLSRVALVNDAEPEFVSATVLPGIGMQLLQASLAVPEQSVQDLLASVPVSDAAQMPPDRVTSAPFHLRISTHHLREKPAGDEDLIGLSPATDAKNQTLVDGGQAAGNFGSSNSRSGVSATVEITLSGRQIDMVARATNHSEEGRFVAFEWNPRFALSAIGGNQARLYVPSHTAPGKLPGSSATGPNGKFAAEGGDALGEAPFDLHFTLLGHDYLSDGTYIRLQNGDRFYLRILGLGDSLRSVHAVNDPASHTLLLGVSSMDSSSEAEQQDQTLRPGQTMQWHLRMEVLAVKSPLGPDSAH